MQCADRMQLISSQARIGRISTSHRQCRLRVLNNPTNQLPSDINARFPLHEPAPMFARVRLRSPMGGEPPALTSSRTLTRKDLLCTHLFSYFSSSKKCGPSSSENLPTPALLAEGTLDNAEEPLIEFGDDNMPIFFRSTTIHPSFHAVLAKERNSSAARPCEAFENQRARARRIENQILCC